MDDRIGKDLKRRNVRVALITLSIAAAIFIGFVLRWTLL